MQTKINAKYIIAFIALNFVMGELHEQAHINTGYLICGCYGARDFSVWGTCEDCLHNNLAFLGTLAGPVFSCFLMWLGAIWFSKSKKPGKRAIGFALLFANMPFARIFTALMGGGDEKTVIRALAGDSIDLLLIKLAALVIVSLVCLPPMIMVFKKLPAKNRCWVLTGFSVIPLIYGMLYHHMFLNWLLKNRIAADTVLLGTPGLILYHFVLMLFVLLLFGKALLQPAAE